MLAGKILEQYFEEHAIVKAVAWKRIEQCVKKLRFFEKTPIGDIDIPMCREYRIYRCKVGDSTVRRELGVLQAAVNHAVRWRRLKSGDQLPSIELPPEGASKTLWLFKEEMSTLLEAAESVDMRVYRFVQLAYHTAARKASIEQLQWCQVDLVAKRIDLKQPGKRETKKRQPIVPISDNIASQLTALKALATTAFVLTKSDPISNAFETVAVAAGLAELKASGLRPAGHLTPHVLRHSRATHLLQDGKSPWAVANLLGDTLPTLLRVYGHFCPSYLEEALS